MYAHISGTVDSVFGDRVVIDAGGVGYELLASSMTLKRVKPGQKVKLYTHLHLAEGIMMLYGFYDSEEKAFFRKLIGVNRVGPKVALSVLSSMTPQEIVLAIMTENVKALAAVPGLGKKTAQRLLLELKESFGTDELLYYGEQGVTVGENETSILVTEAVAALTALGYDGLQAGRAVAAVTDATTVEELITRALRTLAK